MHDPTMTACVQLRAHIASAVLVLHELTRASAPTPTAVIEGLVGLEPKLMAARNQVQGIIESEASHANAAEGRAA